MFIDSTYESIEVNESIGLEVLEAYLLSIFRDIHIDIRSSKQVILSPTCMELYDIIGISTSISVMDQLGEVICAASQLPQMPIIVVGGIYGSYAYQDLLAKFPHVLCAIGEGESTWESIVRTLLDFPGNRPAFMGSLHRIPNLAFIQDGKLAETKRSVIDLSQIFSVPRHNLAREIASQNGIVRIEGSRGCPWNACSFCVLKWKYNHSTWRGYPIEKVINELIALEACHAKAVYFTDEEFLGGTYERTSALVDSIIDLKRNGAISPDMFFAVSTSAKTILGEYSKCSAGDMKALLLKMKTAGFRSFFIGLESGSKSQLDRYNKGVDANTNSAALKLLNSLGIAADIGYILFDPHVTISELCESLAFISENGLRGHMSRFAKRLRLVPKTEYCKLFLMNSPDLKFDMDTIEYSYDFLHHDVAKVFQIYNEWESWHLKETLHLQGLIRGSVMGDELSSVVSRMERLRNKEYDALLHILNCVYARQNVLSGEDYKQYIKTMRCEDFFQFDKPCAEDEQLDLVDENDHIIGQAARSYIYNNDIHSYRVIGVFLRTHDGKLVIPHRSLNSRLFPGRFDFSVAGHVDAGETYEEAAYREAEEELGIDKKKLNLKEYLYVRYPNDLGISSFAKFYCGDCPPDISFDKKGITSIRYLSVEEVSDLIKLSPEKFKPDFLPAFSEYIKKVNNT